MHNNVLYTAKYPVTYWQTEGENYSFTCFTHSTTLPCSYRLFLFLFFFFLQLPTLLWQRQGFEMAKATEVLDLKAPEGN